MLEFWVTNHEKVDDICPLFFVTILCIAGYMSPVLLKVSVSLMIQFCFMSIILLLELR